MTNKNTPRNEPSPSEALDRYGSDLSRWSDRVLAQDAAEAALADRDFRRHLDEARALDGGLAAVRDTIDAEIAASDAVARISASVLSSVQPRPYGQLRWAAAIAVIIFAGGLGSLSDLTIVSADEYAGDQVVLVDPLVFGPLESE